MTFFLRPKLALNLESLKMICWSINTKLLVYEKETFLVNCTNLEINCLKPIEKPTDLLSEFPKTKPQVGTIGKKHMNSSCEH